MAEPALRDVRGDGNCYLRAVFQSAKTLGLLDSLAVCLTLGDAADCRYSICSEEEFVLCARIALAVQIVNTPKTYLDTYKHLRSLDRVNRKAILANQPRWMTPAFRQSENEYEFVQRCARAVETMGNWFAASETQLFASMVERCANVRIVVRSVDTKQEAQERAASYANGAFPRNTLVLINLNDVHYMYVDPGAFGIDARLRDGVAMGDDIVVVGGSRANNLPLVSAVLALAITAAFSCAYSFR